MKAGFVAIIGKPNAGKSTLLNRFIGEKISIVTPKPQTTRKNILGIYNAEGVQAVFLDTPGFHDSKKEMNKLMLAGIDEALADADVVVLMVEPSKNPKDELNEELFNRSRGKKLILAINKIDTVLGEPWGKIVERYYDAYESAPTIAISAKQGMGCDVLLKKIVEFLPEGEPFYPDDSITSHPTRFIAEEIIRGVAMKLLKQELPYSMAVQVESFKEEREPVVIKASIIIEKDSQKAIVIGKKGEMIKKIGTLAREDIEKLIGKKVFLELFVKVEKEWTRNDSKLKEYF